MKALQKRLIKRMDTEVTFIGFGALEIGRDWGLGSGNEVQRPDDEVAGKVLNTVLDLGINLVDTANAYFKSEERIGKYLSSRRKEFILASKCGEHSNEPHTYYDYSFKAIKGSIDKSLLLLKTDVIDLMQIHFGPDPEKVLDEGETVAAMKEAQREGKVRFLGASIDGDMATRCIQSGDFDVMQMDYSLLSFWNEKNIKLASEKGIGVLIRGGLSYGKLTARVIPHLKEVDEKGHIKKLLELVGNDGDALTALALKFLYENQSISSVLAGTKNVNHLKANLQLLEREMDKDIIAKALEIVNN